MKLLCLGCLHGKIPKKLVNRLKKEEFDYVLCTGDLANADRSREISFKNWKYRHAGYRLTDLVPTRRLSTIERYEVNSMQDSINFLKKLRKEVFLIYGNNDFLKEDIRYNKLKSLEPRLKNTNIKLLKANKLNFREFILTAYSGYRHTSHKHILKSKIWKKKDVDKFNHLFREGLNKLFLKNKIDKPIIFMTHDPPYGYFDIVKMKISPMYGKHIGDEYYLDVIKRYKPILHVSSHMHEHQGKKKLGKTWIVNTGAAYLGRYAMVDIEENKVKSIRFGR